MKDSFSLFVYAYTKSKHKNMEIQRFLKDNCIQFRILNDEHLFVCLSDIAKYLNLKNPRTVATKCARHLIIDETKGGPQKRTYISMEDLKKIVCKSRKIEAKNLANILGINVHVELYITIEAETLDIIQRSFRLYRSEREYFIDSYYIDLYFVDLNLAIECDENHHKFEKITQVDVNREKKIQTCIGCKFIRYSPMKKGFNIGDVIGDIMEFIAKSSVSNTYTV